MLLTKTLDEAIVDVESDERNWQLSQIELEQTAHDVNISIAELAKVHNVA